jgi:hypothetical protein
VALAAFPTLVAGVRLGLVVPISWASVSTLAVGAVVVGGAVVIIVARSVFTRVSVWRHRSFCSPPVVVSGLCLNFVQLLLASEHVLIGFSHHLVHFGVHSF